MPEVKFSDLAKCSDLSVEKEDHTNGVITLQTPFFIRALGLAFIILLLTGFQAVFDGNNVDTPQLEDEPARIPVVDTDQFAYTVQEGETLRSIAAMTGNRIETILALNGLETHAILHTGQTLLLPYEPILYRLDTFPIKAPIGMSTSGGLQ